MFSVPECFCFKLARPFSVTTAVSLLLLGWMATAGAEDVILDAKTKCAAINPDPVAGETIEWEGTCLNGLLDGPGTLTRIAGKQVLNSRKGDWSEGRPVGVGELRRGDGVIIRGTWRNGQLDGHVLIYYANGSELFDGLWADGQAQGSGTYHYPNGSTYSGDWLAGKRSGQGSLTKANGDRFEGDWSEDAGNGRVRQRMADGSVYNGNWVNGLRHGHGVLRDANGKTYEGEFCFDLVCPVSTAPKDKFGVPVL
jgi:hypothetical protein